MNCSEGMTWVLHHESARPSGRQRGKYDQGVCPGTASRRRSAEREGEPLRTRVQELNLELPRGDGARLADQLVHALLADGAESLLVGVHAVGVAGRLAD